MHEPPWAGNAASMSYSASLLLVYRDGKAMPPSFSFPILAMPAMPCDARPARACVCRKLKIKKKKKKRRSHGKNRAGRSRVSGAVKHFGSPQCYWRCYRVANAVCASSAFSPSRPSCLILLIYHLPSSRCTCFYTH